MNQKNPNSDPALAKALNELGRVVNLISTYGKNHRASKESIPRTLAALHALFETRSSMLLGVFNGVMTVDGQMVKTEGSLQKSLERRLVRLNITGLRLKKGISEEELHELIELLSTNTAEAFEKELSEHSLAHINTEHTQYCAIQENQTVANKSDLVGMYENGVLVINDDLAPPPQNDLHIDQIIAFLKGDVGTNENTEPLKTAATHPDQLGNLIMEAAAIRQSTATLSGESLNDIILGCLRRTYEGLRKQTDFQTKQGKTELKKALLLLEKSLLDKMRTLTGAEDADLDRKIDQAIRGMNETLDLEIAATEYMEHSEAIKISKTQLQDLICRQGSGSVKKVLREAGLPPAEWHKFVIENSSQTEQLPPSLSDGLSTLTSLFEQLERLMESKPEGTQVKNLLQRANDNLSSSADSTKEKLEALSSTIGGYAHSMPREELLSSLAEITQELMQPLTAINISLEMLLLGYVGHMPDEQVDLLSVAARSGEHLEFLMEMLLEIVGCPINKGTDRRFHTTSDQVHDAKNNSE
ncbi:MAG: hypothetical protein JXR40_05205 [Pontiellaceae bacterium]|nr:hypothetical protein [Pontiellaceae bacterium]